MFLDYSQLTLQSSNYVSYLKDVNLGMLYYDIASSDATIYQIKCYFCSSICKHNKIKEDG